MSETHMFCEFDSYLNQVEGSCPAGSDTKQKCFDTNAFMFCLQQADSNILFLDQHLNQDEFLSNIKGPKTTI